MARDIDILIEKIRAIHPDVTVKQLEVGHPGVDDDGIWFFSVPADSTRDIHVESSSGAAPFLIEHSDAEEAYLNPSINGTVELVSNYLNKLKRRVNKAPDGTASSVTHPTAQ